jgi:hypothetical protein
VHLRDERKKRIKRRYEGRKEGYMNIITGRLRRIKNVRKEDLKLGRKERSK